MKQGKQISFIIFFIQVDAHRETRENLDRTIKHLADTREEIEATRRECADFMKKIR